MTIKELAYSAQQQLQASTGKPLKRAHIYELLTASFGFNSYAALGVDSIFTQQSPGDKRKPCPTRCEPERHAYFQPEMSLKG